jgi:hypothetical protein
MTRVITAIPASGKRIKRVLINGVDSGRLQNIRFPNISASHTLHVEFENGNDYFDFTNTPPQPSNSQATPPEPQPSTSPGPITRPTKPDLKSNGLPTALPPGPNS